MYPSRETARRDLDALSDHWPLFDGAQTEALRAWLIDDAALGRLWRSLAPSGRGLADAIPSRILRGGDHPCLRHAAAGEPPPPALRRLLADDLSRWRRVHEQLPDVPRERTEDRSSRDPFRGPEPPWSARGARAQLLDALHESPDWSALTDRLIDFSARHGVGEAQGCVAFRFEAQGERARLRPIEDFAAFDLDWLSGSTARLSVLEENTRSLLQGYRAHNVLVWGPRGCGKSSAIRGLVTRYWEQGLRGIEVPHRSYALLPQLFDLVRARRERFLAILDNIGLEKGDPATRTLSTALDGGLERAPANLVFYATSNFKDLVDREGERPQGPPASQMDAAPSAMRQTTQTDSVVRRGFDPQGFQRLDEKRALDDRFPLKVYIDLPTKQQYDALVVDYARRAGVALPEEELLERFQVWRMRNNHDLVGGRTARDFVLSLLPALDADRG